MKLRPVYNKKLGRWVICHDKWCKRGETSIVATITTGFDEKGEGELAQKLCDRWNVAEEETNEDHV